ncbi:MAG TPA: hypothetical protein VJT09_08325 [Pyrinomonadaceae bacterium]|nr:hypothetical protein [Pyrinomonadaceae bacterium]
MSEDERQRQMDFIHDSLAQLTAKVDGLADIQRGDAVRTGRLEEAFVTLTRLSERVVDRLDEHNARIANVEDAIVTLTRLVEQGKSGA